MDGRRRIGDAVRDGGPRHPLGRTPGVELLGDMRVLPDGYAWQHFRAPDGHVYELTAEPSSRQ
jgi:hypothetical protein